MAVSLLTLTDRSIKNMGTGIHPVVKETILEVIRRAYAEGIYAQVSSGYRSNAEQQKLYNQGRITPGQIVTNAKPGQSMHNYGLAIDYFLVSDDGKQALWTVNDKWRRFAAIAKSLGFKWGGDWTIARDGIVDYPHLEMTGGLTLRDLQNGKRPNLSLKLNPGAAQSSLNGSEVKKLQKDLLELGYKLPKFGADGDYGAETEKAVKAFQLANGLKADGIASKETLVAIKEQIEGGLIMKQYIELKKIIEAQAKEIAALKKNKQNAPKSDAPVDPVHEKNWIWAKEEGLLDGTRPQESVTREQLATILYRNSNK